MLHRMCAQNDDHCGLRRPGAQNDPRQVRGGAVRARRRTLHRHPRAHHHRELQQVLHAQHRPPQAIALRAPTLCTAPRPSVSGTLDHLLMLCLTSLFVSEL